MKNLIPIYGMMFMIIFAGSVAAQEAETLFDDETKMSFAWGGWT